MYVTNELTHDSLVVRLAFSRYVGNGLEGLGRCGCSQKGPALLQTLPKTHGHTHPKAPKPLPTKRESVSNITKESHVGSLVTCLLKRTFPFETNAIQAFAQIFHFCLF